MICALFILISCDGVPSTGSEPAAGPAVALASAPKLRNCLKVAGGLKTSGDGAAASEQVLACYEKHFAPMKAVVRERNERAALSLEYGFGRLARAMTVKGDDVGQQAEQLADRVEAVLASLEASEAEVSE